jgi:hypothetical protein
LKFKSGHYHLGAVFQFALFRSAAVPAAASDNREAFEISDSGPQFYCAAGEDTRAPFKSGHCMSAFFALEFFKGEDEDENGGGFPCDFET